MHQIIFIIQIPQTQQEVRKVEATLRQQICNMKKNAALYSSQDSFTSNQIERSTDEVDASLV
jgi:hypothetical protein